MLTLETATTGRRGWLGEGQDRGRGVDPLALLAVAALVGLGELNLVAIGETALAVHQLAAVLGGLALLLVLLRVRAASLPVLGSAAYGVALVLLLAVVAKGRGAYGAQRWFSLGFFDLQPSELAKLGLLILLAHLLSPTPHPASAARGPRRGAGSAERPGPLAAPGALTGLLQRGAGGAGWRRAAVAIAAAAVPVGLTLRQPDLSTATMLALLTLAVLILARAPVALLAAVFGTAAAAAPIAVHLLRPYQVARLDAFLAGTSSSAGPGWAILQAHIAVGWGGLLGRAQDPLHELLASYLPARESDLAFASLVEQWGLAAGAAAVAAVIVLVWRLARASHRARTLQGALVAAGLALLLGCETVVSIGGNLGALPLAGVPFPFLSYGGTVAAVHLAALGLALAGPREARRRQLWMPPRRRRPRPRLVRLAAIGLALQLAALSVFAWHLQQVNGDQLRLAGQVQMSRCVAVPAPRGIIT
ncbi:MAG TPA: FtsW/RodA/SpoVE family cell cycle protein, partial [Candidatus Eisenbacteria bacterium]|nr:FtsW/RodA/SpoVE family cell cycle protein [Candidatus Eisenbacteria bacterium]